MASTSSIPRSNSAVSGRTIAVDVPPAVIRALGTTQNAVIGYQIYDPESGMFIAEGEWSRVESDSLTLDVVLPPERGRYLVYISALNEASGWAYQRGKLFLVLDAFVERGQASVARGPRETTMRALRRQTRRRQIRLAFTLPFRTIAVNRSLLSSMVRRDILARYRGSFGDVLWTVLNPLLLIGTYFVVFGVLLQSKFGPDNSRTGYVLYLLAGILPWLAFSEAVGRSPHVMVEHRNFIKKLVFPVEILPVTQTISALVTQAFTLAIFVLALVIVRGSMPLTALFLPVLLVPQVMFTLGIAWFLSALGVFLRDLRPDHQFPADALVLAHTDLLSRNHHPGRTRQDPDKKPDLHAGPGVSRDPSRRLPSRVPLALETLAVFRRRIRAGLRLVPQAPQELR